MTEIADLILKIGGVVFACGMVWAELKALRKDIARVEQKVEKHNNFDRRIIRLETIIEERENNAKV